MTVYDQVFSTVADEVQVQNSTDVYQVITKLRSWRNNSRLNLVMICHPGMQENRIEIVFTDRIAKGQVMETDNKSRQQIRSNLSQATPYS